MSDPFRTPRLPAREVRRVLRRAAELAEDDPDTGSVEKTMTQDELERAAGELGLPASAIARAIGAPGDRDAVPTSPRSFFLGAPLRIFLEDELPGEPTDADREDLVDAIRITAGQTGSVESVGKTLVWKLSSGPRSARDFSVRIRSRNGRTRVVVEERLNSTAVGLFVGMGVGGGVGPMAGYVAAVVKLGVMGLVFPLLWIPCMLLLARTIFAAMARRRARLVREVMDRVKANAARWQVEALRARVGVAAAAAEESQAESEANADVPPDAPARRSRA
jgi:hypothetical protein